MQDLTDTLRRGKRTRSRVSRLLQVAAGAPAQRAAQQLQQQLQRALALSLRRGARLRGLALDLAVLRAAAAPARRRRPGARGRRGAARAMPAAPRLTISLLATPSLQSQESTQARAPADVITAPPAEAAARPGSAADQRAPRRQRAARGTNIGSSGCPPRGARGAEGRGARACAAASARACCAAVGTRSSTSSRPTGAWCRARYVARSSTRRDTIGATCAHGRSTAQQYCSAAGRRPRRTPHASCRRSNRQGSCSCLFCCPPAPPQLSRFPSRPPAAFLDSAALSACGTPAAAPRLGSKAGHPWLLMARQPAAAQRPAAAAWQAARAGRARGLRAPPPARSLGRRLRRRRRRRRAPPQTAPPPRAPARRRLCPWPRARPAHSQAAVSPDVHSARSILSAGLFITCPSAQVTVQQPRAPCRQRRAFI